APASGLRRPVRRPRRAAAARLDRYCIFMHNNSKFMHARRETLRRIITGSPVGRQEDLVRLLGKAGFPATQSSVSRDLRELGVAKRGDRYVLPDERAPVVDDFAAVARFVRSI